MMTLFISIKKFVNDDSLYAIIKRIFFVDKMYRTREECEKIACVFFVEIFNEKML